MPADWRRTSCWADQNRGTGVHGVAPSGPVGRLVAAAGPISMALIQCSTRRGVVSKRVLRRSEIRQGQLCRAARPQSGRNSNLGSVDTASLSAPLKRIIQISPITGPGATKEKWQ